MQIHLYTKKIIDMNINSNSRGSWTHFWEGKKKQVKVPNFSVGVKTVRSRNTRISISQLCESGFPEMLSSLPLIWWEILFTVDFK